MNTCAIAQVFILSSQYKSGYTHTPTFVSKGWCVGMAWVLKICYHSAI